MVMAGKKLAITTKGWVPRLKPVSPTWVVPALP